MSYDLMVFEPQAAPSDHTEFLNWYQGSWDEEYNRYDDPSVLSDRLQGWFAAMTQLFPSSDGDMVDTRTLPDKAIVADYNLGKEIIYGCFEKSKKAEVYESAFRLAKLHELGFFEVSSRGKEVWLPQGGELVMIHQKEEPSLLGSMRRLFGTK